MTVKQELTMLRSEVNELRQLATQQAILTQELSIIIQGSKTLGVEGIHAYQRREEVFKERILEQMVVFQKALDENTSVIMSKVDERVIDLEKGLSDVAEWKATWTKAIGLISSSTTWRVLFIIGLGIAGVIIFAKFKLTGVVQGLDSLINNSK